MLARPALHLFIPDERALSVDTRSAVSSNVNWLIWSTMPAILGLAAPAAASVDCHLRDSSRLLRPTTEVAGRIAVCWDDRNVRAHCRVAYWHV